MNVNEQMFEKLVDSFGDFKERLIRIEERLKVVDIVKDDVEKLKIANAENSASTKSAHRRIDAFEKREQEKEADIKWLKRTVIGGLIGTVFAVISGLIIAVAKGWI